MIKEIQALVEHCADQGRIFDRSADPAEGEDPHYYELNAGIVDAVVHQLQAPVKVYAVRSTYGIYDDFNENIEKLFFVEKEALEYIKQKEALSADNDAVRDYSYSLDEYEVQ